MNIIRNLLLDKRLIDLNNDEDRRIELHNQILSSKKMMKDVFLDFYLLCLSMSNKFFCDEGLELEIGSGVSFFKSIHKELITSDIISAKNLDIKLDAQNMVQFEDATIKAIYGLNVFHHFNHPRKFLSELCRVLKPNGGCVLIEPFYGLVAKHFYKNLHASEGFDPFQKDWETKDQTGAMCGANQALSYIVFVRDREIFNREFPELEIVYLSPVHNYLRYLFSGGLNFKQLLPDCFSYPLKACEFLLRPVSSMTALHYCVVIRRKS